LQPPARSESSTIQYHLQKKAILVELAGGVLPRIGNDMWASRTVAPKLITQPAADELPLLSRRLQLSIPIGVELLLR
jgi:hypothetical protein